MSDTNSTAKVSEWRQKQDTPIAIPYSLAYALWDFCCAKGRGEDAQHLADAIESVFPGWGETSDEQ